MGDLLGLFGILDGFFNWIEDLGDSFRISDRLFFRDLRRCVNWIGDLLGSFGIFGIL